MCRIITLTAFQHECTNCEYRYPINKDLRRKYLNADQEPNSINRCSPLYEKKRYTQWSQRDGVHRMPRLRQSRKNMMYYAAEVELDLVYAIRKIPLKKSKTT